MTAQVSSAGVAVPVAMSLRKRALRSVRQRHQAVYLIISPPRCASTVIARAFWEQPSIRYYCNEPFELMYHRGFSLDRVADRILTPIDLTRFYKPSASANSLLVKDLTFQVGAHLPELLAFATAPVLFLIRDPRLNIRSRMEMKARIDGNPLFPLAETGWDALADQIETAERAQVPFAILDTSDLRERPLDGLAALCNVWRLPPGDPTLGMSHRPLK